MLCHHSKYFGRAFNGLFKETLEHRIHLEEDDPAIFALLIEWMYTQNLHVYKDHVYDAIDVQEPLKGACDTLCELFCMSEKLLVDGIQEDIKEELDRAFDRAGNHFPIEPHTIMAMYNNTHADSKFRKFILENLAANLVDCQGRHIKYYQDCIEGPDAIPGFSMDLMMKMKNERSKDFWSE